MDQAIAFLGKAGNSGFIIYYQILYENKTIIKAIIKKIKKTKLQN